MKPDVKRILTKLSENKIELAARKPQAILKDAEKLDSQIDQQKNKIEKVWSSYKKAWNEWQDFLNIVDEKATQIYLDVNETADKLRDLGIEPKSVSELMKANDLGARAGRDVSGLKKLYSKPE